MTAKKPPDTRPGGRPARERPQGDPAATALQDLSQRLARGEIRPEEYEERKAALLTTMVPPRP